MTGIDQDIARRFHDGDLEALENIVEAYQGAVFGIGMKMLGTVHDAKDFSQDVFMLVYEKRKRFDPERPFEPWFYKVAMNHGRERLRKRREIPRSDTMPVETVEETAGNMLMQNEMRENVRTALQELKPEYRECLALRFEADMQLQEIAETLDLPLGTVKTRLRRGLMAFRELWLKKGEKHEMH